MHNVMRTIVVCGGTRTVLNCASEVLNAYMFA